MRSRVLISSFVVLTLARQAHADEPASPPTTPAAAEPAPGADAPRSAEDGSVFLHVSSSKAVTIERDDTGEVVCTSPCDKSVRKDVTYHVGGGHRPSPSFVLSPPESGRANLRVKPGSQAGFWAGVGGVALGTVLIGGGIATLIYGLENRADVPGADGETTDNSYTDTMSLGTTLVLGGVCVGVAGGAFLLANASTTVRGNVRTGSTPSVPTSRTQASTGPVQLPKPNYVSIFSGTF